MGKGGVAVAAQRKRNESHTVAEPAMSGSLKRVRPKPKRVRLRRGESSNLGRHPRGDDNSRARAALNEGRGSIMASDARHGPPRSP